MKTFPDTMSEASEAIQRKIGFDEAFTLHHRTVFRCARSIVNDSAAAEDIVQEVFLKYYNHQADIKSEEMLRPWLIRVTMNLSRNAVRGKIRANAREENYFKENEENSIFEPENDYEKREQAKEIRRILDTVREPYRSCLILKQQGLSYREIAETLSLNEGSIGQYIARARQEFASIYGKQERIL